MVAFVRYNCFPIACSSNVLYKRGAPEDIDQSPAVRYTAYEGWDSVPSVVSLGDGGFGIAWVSGRQFTEGVWNSSNHMVRRSGSARRRVAARGGEPVRTPAHSQSGPQRRGVRRGLGGR